MLDQPCYTMSEVAAVLGVRAHQIRYAHEKGRLAEPARVNNYRVYTPADVERARHYFEDRRRTY